MTAHQYSNRNISHPPFESITHLIFQQKLISPSGLHDGLQTSSLIYPAPASLSAQSSDIIFKVLFIYAHIYQVIVSKSCFCQATDYTHTFYGDS